MSDPKKILCKFFAHGACKKGDTCPFSHTKGDRPNMVCVFYQRGVCSYGNNCRYDHVRTALQRQTPNVSHHSAEPLTQTASSSKSKPQIKNEPSRQKPEASGEMPQLQPSAANQVSTSSTVERTAPDTTCGSSETLAYSFQTGMSLSGNSMPAPRTAVEQIDHQQAAASESHLADKPSVGTPASSTNEASAHAAWADWQRHSVPQGALAAGMQPPSWGASSSQWQWYGGGSEQSWLPGQNAGAQVGSYGDWAGTPSNGFTAYGNAPTAYQPGTGFESPETLWRSAARCISPGLGAHLTAGHEPWEDAYFLEADKQELHNGVGVAAAGSISGNDTSRDGSKKVIAHALFDDAKGETPTSEAGTVNVSHTKDTALCTLATTGRCTLGSACPRVHGETCPHCKKACLHPLRPEETAEHIKICQRNQRKLDSLRRSQEIECSVCLDRVLSKPKLSERKFGILSHCDHPHCIGCIRGWRNAANQGEATGLDLDSAIRACPVCRVQSHYVTPSVVWYFSPEEKEEIVNGYKHKLSEIDCRHFNFGDGNCPFGTSCFYRHKYRDGRMEEVHLRHLGSADGGTVIAKEIRLSDFITAARPRSRR